jgi:hypothetical protein
MDVPSATYFHALGAIACTFSGLSALVMVFNQSDGHRPGRRESWLTLVFIELGFIVTAASLAPSLLALCGLSEDLIWRACSAVGGVAIAAFASTYPRRRRTAAPTVMLPLHTRLNLFALWPLVSVFIANAVGGFWRPGAGGFAVGLTGVLFVGGLGYVRALGTVRSGPGAATLETQSAPEVASDPRPSP